jgi:hypothetical protein
MRYKNKQTKTGEKLRKCSDCGKLLPRGLNCTCKINPPTNTKEKVDK